MKEVHVVGAAIIDGNKILVAQRSEKMMMPLKWEFVGGKVEEGESHQQALEREVYEELGIKIQVCEHIATGSSTVNDKRIILHVYKSQWISGPPIAKEHAQIQWIDMKNIMELDWPEADIPACRELAKMDGV